MRQICKYSPRNQAPRSPPNLQRREPYYLVLVLVFASSYQLSANSYVLQNSLFTYLSPPPALKIGERFGDPIGGTMSTRLLLLRFRSPPQDLRQGFDVRDLNTTNTPVYALAVGTRMRSYVSRTRKQHARDAKRCRNIKKYEK
ncbi:hypothetical protein XAUC_43280 [Xanthomonas citri pv. aurantifolii str. ICPB 10535]|nr:hypothetical protein XAUC_43280 [Xanthomonas citri pv. aurantifolii str. ICPB 10535]